MASRITIFDKNLHSLTELHGIPTTPRSWVMNSQPDAGRCEFAMSLSDAKVSETNLQYGNPVFIRHLPTQTADGTRNGQMPDWVGWIMPPRAWDIGVVHVTCYAAETILSARPMPWAKVKGTPKTIFLEILGHANEFSRRYGSGLIIQPGVVEDIAETFSYDLRNSAYEHIRTAVKNAGMYWDVTGNINAKGQLELYANLYQSRGVETYFDLNNLNTEAGPGQNLMTEQGFPANLVIGHSQANTAQDRHIGIGANQAAVDDYGPLGGNITFMGLRDASSTQAAAQAHAETRGRPVKMTSRTALDIGQTFSNLDLGNVINIKDRQVGFSPNGGFGFDARAQIISMKYNDMMNEADLQLEVI
jgi:hypothetical protein